MTVTLTQSLVALVTPSLHHRTAPGGRVCFLPCQAQRLGGSPLSARVNCSVGPSRIIRRSSFRTSAKNDDGLPTETATDDQPTERVIVTPSEASQKKEGILPSGWSSVGLVLFGAGFVLGPLLDGIHSRVQLQIYDNGAIDILQLHTNIWVPPLLGVFYSVAGLLQLALDRTVGRKQGAPRPGAQKVLASFLTLWFLLALSAEMYKAGVPYNIEAYILFALAELNWFVFENTWWGFALASFVAVTCPLAELPLNKWFGLWHYPNPNLILFGEGVITWVLCCYFFYTPFISNLARWVSRIIENRTKELKR